MDFAVPAEVVIQTDRALFRSILTNLLANTVEYTPVQGRVEARWDSQTQALNISNTVQDLNRADLPHLFERLWRKDKSRTGGDHCGLGLALSQAFADMLELNLAARLTEEGTLVMTLSRRVRARVTAD
jgi:signal transduction histidine kinase